MWQLNLHFDLIILPFELFLLQYPMNILQNLQLPRLAHAVENKMRKLLFYRICFTDQI